MSYAEFHCVHLLYSSVQFETIWGEAGIKGVGSRGSVRYVLKRKSPYGFDESRDIYLPRLVQTGRQVDCHCPSLVFSSLGRTNSKTGDFIM